jgi:hypothetical protein
LLFSYGSHLAAFGSEKVKNLILGFATNLPKERIQIFCNSARSVYSEDECDVGIITNDTKGIAYLADIGVDFYPTPSRYSRSTTSYFTKALARFLIIPLSVGRLPNRGMYALIEKLNHPFMARWYAYRRILASERWGKVLLADVKDVVFQAPFFDSVPDDQVLFCEQSQVYGTAYYDTTWYKAAWGHAAFQKVSGKQSLCAGTIAGTHSLVRQTVEEVTKFLARHPFGKVDQAIFNHMIYTDVLQVPFTHSKNVTGPVATLTTDDVHSRIRIESGKICREDLSVIPIVHMYDRWPDTLSAATISFANVARLERV